MLQRSLGLRLSLIIACHRLASNPSAFGQPLLGELATSLTFALLQAASPVNAASPVDIEKAARRG
jgi:hypothetical protein